MAAVPLGFDGQGAGADGLLFVLQKAGATALGAAGGRLGYATAADGSAALLPASPSSSTRSGTASTAIRTATTSASNVNGSVFSVAGAKRPGASTTGPYGPPGSTTTAGSSRCA